MKKIVKMFVIGAVLLLLAACGGKGDDYSPLSSNTPVALSLAYKAESKAFEIRNGTNGKYAIVTFTNLSSGSVNRTLSLPQPNPVFPLVIPIEKGYNHVEVRYSGSGTIEAGTDFVPEGRTARSLTPSFSAYSSNTAKPRVIPNIPGNNLVLLAPSSGDYSPVVAYSYQKKDGTWENNYQVKPSLPLEIPLRSGFERLVVSTGRKSSNGVYIKAGSEIAWEYGEVVTAGSTSPTPTNVPTTPTSPPNTNYTPGANGGSVVRWTVSGSTVKVFINLDKMWTGGRLDSPFIFYTLTPVGPWIMASATKLTDTTWAEADIASVTLPNHINMSAGGHWDTNPSLADWLLISQDGANYDSTHNYISFDVR